MKCNGTQKKNSVLNRGARGENQRRGEGYRACGYHAAGLTYQFDPNNLT